MPSISTLLRLSAIALPAAMAVALAVRVLSEPPSWHKLTGAVFMFALTCWLARFQWRRSFDQEAVFGIARVAPTDSEATKLSVDVVSLAGGVLLVGAVALGSF